MLCITICWNIKWQNECIGCRWAKAFLNEWIEFPLCWRWNGMGYALFTENSNEWIRYTRSFLYIIILMKQSCDWVTWSWRNTYIRWVCVHNLVTPYSTNWNFSFKRIFSVVIFFSLRISRVVQRRKHTFINFNQRKVLNQITLRLVLECLIANVTQLNRMHDFPRRQHICQHIRVCIARTEKNGKQFFRIRWLMNFLLSLMFVLNIQKCTHAPVLVYAYKLCRWWCYFHFEINFIQFKQVNAHTHTVLGFINMKSGK